MIRSILIIAGWTLVLALGGWLRFADLGLKPMHADEATGARLMAAYLESGDYVFDPKHFHGPLQAMLSRPITQLRGAEGWTSLDKATLRILPATAGLLSILTPLLFLRRLRPLGALAAGLFLATSPLLVYYSRMFIHETLFAFGILLTLAAILFYANRPNWPRALLLGLAVGLIAVTRETFAISVIAWLGAFGIILFETRRQGSLPAFLRQFPVFFRHGLIAVLGAFVLIILLYTDFLRAPQGVIDFFRTYFVYEVTAGHEKPFFYYLDLMLTPKQAGRLLWTELGIFALAVAGYIITFFRRDRDEPILRDALIARFLAYSILGHLLIYSLIAYKTPWLMCGVWVQVMLLAGYGAGRLLTLTPRLAVRMPIAALILLVTAFQLHQSRLVVWKLHSHPRNPYAYVPTTPDVERLSDWLRKIQNTVPAMRNAPVAVLGDQYWPLPWYLRSFEKIGYWPDLPPNAAEFPVLLVLPNAPGNPAEDLAETHQYFLRGVRYEVPVVILLRKDIWQAHLGENSKSQIPNTDQ